MNDDALTGDHQSSTPNPTRALAGPTRHGDEMKAHRGIGFRLSEWRKRRNLKSAARGTDVFISYSHSGNQKLPPALQRGLSRLGKRWNRPHALRVFRDQTDLTASPDFWSDIERALAGSNYFLLIASPAAANSRWVYQEVAYWQQHKPGNHLLIALADGEIRWAPDRQDFAWEHTNALPTALSGYFSSGEPLWVDVRPYRDAEPSLDDPRFADAVATLAAPVHGIGKAELISEDVRAHRTFTRIRAGAIAALSVLLVLAVAAASIAVVQRNEARNQARISLSKQLAATADSLLATNLRAALQLAVAAYRTDPSPQTMSTLIHANLATPKLVRYLSADATIADAVGSADGKTIVAGLSGGRVIRWNSGGPDVAASVGTLDKSIDSLAVSADGSAIVAADGSEATLWRTGHAPTEVNTQDADAVGIAPSGRTAVVHSGGAGSRATQSLTILDVASATTVVRDDPLAKNDLTETRTITVTSDDEVLLFDDAYGDWDHRRITDWTPIGASSIHVGTRQRSGTPSADGRFLTATNGDPTIPVWTTNAPVTGERPVEGDFGATFTAQAPNSDPPGFVTLSPDGTALAIADGSSMYVTPIAPTGATRVPATEVTGVGPVAKIAFFGDSTHLLSVADRHIALWDLGRIDRLATTMSTPLEDTCRACGDPGLSISPGARRAAIMTDPGSGSTRLIIEALPGEEPAR